MVRAGRLPRTAARWPAAIALAAILGPAALALEFSKTIDRRFPTGYCPIDNDDFDLTFVAETDRALIRFETDNFVSGSWLDNRFDNIAVVAQSVFDAHRVVTPDFEFCYLSPGSANTPGYDFSAASTPEAYLEMFDTAAIGWERSGYGYHVPGPGVSAPRDPQVGNDRTGGAFGLGTFDDGEVRVGSAILVTGLTPGLTYVLTGWWSIGDLTALTVIFDTAPCKDRDGDGMTDCAGDCDDGTAKVKPGLAEACDGRDNDCNGAIDDAASCNRSCDAPLSVGSDLRVTNADFLSTNPSVAWNGTDYAVVYKDSRNGAQEIFFSRVGPSGVKIGGDLNLTPGCFDCNNPRIVWAGGGYGAVWEQNGIVSFRRIDRQGAPIGTPLVLAGTSFGAAEPDLVWSGTEYGVVWWQYAPTPELFFTRVDPLGRRVTPELRVTNAGGGTGRPRIAWSGSQYGIAYTAAGGFTNEIWFLRVDPEDGKLGGDVQITSTGIGVASPEIVWSGSDWGLVWMDLRHASGEIYFGRVSAAGAEIGSELRVTNAGGDSSQPTLAWTGSEYGVAWRDFRSGDYEIWYARLGPTGVKLGSDFRVTSAAGDSQEPSLAWAGSKFGVSFRDSRAGDISDETYFARLGCDCVDGDGDLASSCVECDDTRAAVFPGAAQSCDGLNNDCGDPNWPLLAGTNEADGDGDGFSVCTGDCSDANAAVWATPGEVRSVLLAHNAGTGTTTMTWAAPLQPGASAPAYDTLKATAPAGFVSGTCVETNDASNTASTDATALAPGGRLFYLVRAENACPAGQGTLGWQSNGTPRNGRACP